MEAELRSDGLHISGYVNVPGRPSRPVMTPRGRVIEIIEQRAFERAIAKAQKISMLLDHDKNHVLADTDSGTLMVKEDAIGLRAESVTNDKAVIEGAKQGKLKGWSFDMRNVVDELEERAEGLPIRRVKDFEMSEITLAMNKIPVYSSTSIEVRADGTDNDVEMRAIAFDSVKFTDVIPATHKKTEFDNSEYEKRLKARGI